MGLDQLLVGEIEARRRHGTRDHRGRLREIVPVVGVAVAGEGEHQRRPAAAPGTAAALRVVGRVGRNVPQMHDRELADVDAQLHGRGAAQDREVALAERRLAQHPVLGRHLPGVLGREHARHGAPRDRGTGG